MNRNSFETIKNLDKSDSRIKIKLEENKKIHEAVVKNLEVTETKRIQSCLNNVKPRNKIALTSLIVADHPNYVISASKSIKTIINNTKGLNFDKIIIEVESKPLKEESKKMLLNAGWDFVCSVKHVNSIDDSRFLGHYRETYTKLITMNMTEYEGIVNMDTDILYFIAVAQDTEADGKPRDRFNSGVFSVRPNSTEFSRLMLLRDRNSSHVSLEHGEQTFINYWYKDKWFRFDFKFNGIVWILQNYGWDLKKLDIDVRVFHFTSLKPWNCIPQAVEICKLWSDIPV
ncbi:unnamed protein product [Brachionus calyciflorus]|uniref:Uncharacterized protein n=1 Tax=Brachionus calyciflorus TaxID=104777 RepID=A0A813V3S0_9BILA|nr:unnamed protein product [Brachionus calyciflorus]